MRNAFLPRTTAEPTAWDSADPSDIYSGDTLEQAVIAATEARGATVTIVAARCVKQGLAGLMGKQRFEVLAEGGVLREPVAAQTPTAPVMAAHQPIHVTEMPPLDVLPDTSTMSFASIVQEALDRAEEVAALDRVDEVLPVRTFEPPAPAHHAAVPETAPAVQPAAPTAMHERPAATETELLLPQQRFITPEREAARAPMARRQELTFIEPMPEGFLKAATAAAEAVIAERYSPAEASATTSSTTTTASTSVIKAAQLNAPEGEAPSWSALKLAQVGVPIPIIEAMRVEEGRDEDLRWLCALTEAIAAFVPEPAPLSEDNAVIMKGLGPQGALAMVRAGVLGLTPGILVMDGRKVRATATELALAIRTLVVG